MPNFVLLYFPEDLEKFKALDPNIDSIEKCIKTEESVYVS